MIQCGLRQSRWLAALGFLGIIGILAFGSQDAVAEGSDASKKDMRLIDVSMIDESTDLFGTFHSHNQKIIQNAAGIFMTYIKAADPSGDRNNGRNLWRLIHSTDGGKNFSIIFESRNGTKAPVIDTGEKGRFYLAHSEWFASEGTGMYLHRFTPGNYQRIQCIESWPLYLSVSYVHRK